MAAKLSPLFNDQTLTAANTFASGYKLFTYAAGSSTKQSTFTDSAGTVPQSNPIILNASGQPTNGPIWLAAGNAYKFVLALPTDTDPPTSPVKTFDNIIGVGDAGAISVSQWQPSGLTPAYVSTTSFTVPGDQTIELHIGRRVQFTTTGGTVYGLIATTAFAALTTVGMTMDSGQVLDSGLSVVNLSLLRNDRLALPASVATSGANNDITSFGQAVTGITPPQFDNSTKLATMAALVRSGWAPGVTNGVNGGTTLTVAHSGKICLLNGTPGTITLPASTTFPADRSGVIAFWAQSNGWTINRAGSDNIYMGASTVTSATLNAGDTLYLVSDGGTGWIVFGGSAQLQYSSTMGTPAAARVQGLVGAPNAATPLTKYDLSADEVVLRNANGGTVTRYITGTITNDLGLAGSAVNGRDQSAAFTASSWIYLYFIWNGTTLATVSSTAVPTTGPTLPSGYTHWAFATALRWNASSNIIPAFTCGSRVDYNLTENTGSPVNQVLTAGVATSFTAVDVSGLVPPISRIAKFNFVLSISDSRAAGTSFTLAVRPTGSGQLGQYTCRFAIQVTNTLFVANNWTDYPVSASQQIDYFINVVPSGLNSGAYILVDGYKISNGDS